MGQRAGNAEPVDELHGCLDPLLERRRNSARTRGLSVGGDRFPFTGGPARSGGAGAREAASGLGSRGVTPARQKPPPRRKPLRLEKARVGGPGTSAGTKSA
jgi:hypothetical protein